MQDLSTELFWGRADNDMPQEYVESVMAQINAHQHISREPSQLKRIEKRLQERQRREDEKIMRQFFENYELAEVEYFDGGYSEIWRVRRKP